MTKDQKSSRDHMHQKASMLTLPGVWERLKLMFLLLKDYLGGNYTSAPKRIVFAIFGAFFYLISPVDLLPEVMFPLVGYLDDVLLLGLAMTLVDKDLDQYKAWRGKRKKERQGKAPSAEPPRGGEDVIDV